MADDARVTAQSINVLREGTPIARVTAQSINVLREGTPVARVTAQSINVLRSIPPAPARLIQQHVQTLSANEQRNARLVQQHVQVVTPRIEFLLIPTGTTTSIGQALTPLVAPPISAPWHIFDSFKLRMGDGTHDLNTHTFKAALFTSAYTPTSADTSYTSLSGEVVTGNNYSTGGEAISRSWTESAGVVTFDADGILFDAIGGSIVCRHIVIYNSTSAGKELVGYLTMDDSPADVTILDGKRMIIVLDVDGIFEVE